jgi:hypothetical protein
MDKGNLRGDIIESEKLDFLHYLYGNLMQSFVDYDNNEITKEKILSFVNKKENCERHCFYEESYFLPLSSKTIFRDKISSSYFEENSFT